MTNTCNCHCYYNYTCTPAGRWYSVKGDTASGCFPSACYAPCCGDPGDIEPMNKNENKNENENNNDTCNSDICKVDFVINFPINTKMIELTMASRQRICFNNKTVYFFKYPTEEIVNNWRLTASKWNITKGQQSILITTVVRTCINCRLSEFIQNVIILRIRL